MGNGFGNREVLDKIEELQDKVNKVIEQNEKLLNMLFEIDRKTLKPKLKEIADAERW